MIQPVHFGKPYSIQTSAMKCVYNQYRFRPGMLPALFLIIALASCSNKSTKEELPGSPSATPANTSSSDQRTEVSISQVVSGPFVIQKVINGKVEALHKTVIKAESSGLVEVYRLEEGKYVRPGDTLIALEKDDLLIQLEQRNNQLDDAIVARNERFINDGGEPDDESSLPARRVRLHNILSGYNKAITGIREIEHQLEKKVLLTPMRGWIADIKVKDKEYITAGQEICTLIDPASFEIKMQWMENEAINLTRGTTVTAYPLLDSGRSVKARINRIRPIVGETGLVTVWARIISGNDKLFEGMNMRVEVEQIIPGQMKVPKEALVSRSGRDVVFVYDTTSSLAKWKYVNIAYENKDDLAISEGVQPGDWVIIEGNLNLDHDTGVQVKKQ